MNPEELIEWLEDQMYKKKTLKTDEDIVFGFSPDRVTVLDEDSMQIINGQVFINTYEGM